MHFCKIPTFLLCVFFLVSSTTSQSPRSMNGGIPAKPGQFPFVVSIQIHLKDHDVQSCVGAIFNNQWVITVAQCFWPNVAIEDVYVVAGTIDLDGSGLKYNLSQIVTHPDFKPTINVWNDVAVVQIDGNFEFTDLVGYIDVADVAENQPASLIAWDLSPNITVPELSFIDVLTLSAEQCFIYGNGSIYNSEPRGPGQLCAFSKDGGVGGCYGGAGGPLVHNDTLVGLVSYTLDELCTVHKYPDVYTRVGYYSDWIKETIAGNGKTENK